MESLLANDVNVLQESKQARALAVEAQQLRERTGQGEGAFRVNQLDAAQMDDELFLMLGWQLKRVFKFFHPELLVRFKPELDAALQLTIFRFTVWRDRPTPGSQLQNVCQRSERWWDDLAGVLPWPLSKYCPTPAPAPAAGHSSLPLYPMSKSQKLLYCVASVALAWTWRRGRQWMLHHEWGEKPEDDWRRDIYRMSSGLDILYRAASIANFLSFLWNGRYRSVLDRLLGIQMTFIKPRQNRQLTFDFMNQQLVWHAFAEFILFFLPLLNFDKLKQWIRRFVVEGLSSSASAADANSRSVRSSRGSCFTFCPRCGRSCPVCGTDSMVTPVIASCGHLYCYYCLSSSRLAEKPRLFVCPRCHTGITGMAPHEQST